MPEGDTIHRAARTLHLALAGKTVVSFETALAQLSVVDRVAPITGRTVEAVEALGKHLLMHFSGGLVLRTHMRMNGSWHLYRVGERWRKPRRAMRLALTTADYAAVGFDIPVAELVPAAELHRHRPLARLGPDLLGAQFDAGEAERRLRARAELPVAEALLDQGALAGIGNVFKSEILFATRIHPQRRVGSLADEELRRLLYEAERQLRANVPSATPSRGSWTGGRRTTGRMNPEESLWVYGRVGEPCRRCGERILLAKSGLGARLTYWCPRCQPGG